MFRKLLIKIFPYFYLSLSLGILLYIYYKDQILYDGYNFSYYKNYYLFFSINLLISIVNVILEKIQIYFFITLTSILLSIYIFEVYLNLLKIDSPDIDYKIKEYKKIYNKNYDTRSKIEVMNDLSKSNDNVSIAIFPSLFINQSTEIYPLSGISNSKTVYDNENGYYFIYDSDRYGFNNPDYIWDEEQIEYLLIGDSFVHGASVNKPSDISSILRKKLSKNILNISYGGNGPLLQLASLIEYIPNKVKNIIWFYYEGNDNYDLDNELKNKKLSNYLNNEKFKQNLKNKKNETDLFLKNYLKNFIKNEKKTEKKVLLNIIKLDQVRKILHKNELPNSYLKILKKVKKIAETKNSNLYFVYLPEYGRYKLNFYKDDNRKKVLNLVNSLNINYIDMHEEVFLNVEEPLELFPFKMFGHYNKKGYKNISNVLYKNLLN